jgi:hypothetical protein
MKLISLYSYPHPFDPCKWLYVGQGVNRDSRHRSGKTSFGRRFKALFPDIRLPGPVRWAEPADNHLDANLAETVAMFRYHAWHGYPGGMNLTLPGSQDYTDMGHIGGKVNSEKPGYFARIGHIGGLIGGHKGGITAIRKLSREAKVRGGKEAARIQPREAKVRGGHAGGSIGGHLGGPIGALITNCLRWNVHRGKPCICGKHKILTLSYAV